MILDTRLSAVKLAIQMLAAATITEARQGQAGGNTGCSQYGHGLSCAGKLISEADIVAAIQKASGAGALKEVDRAKCTGHTELSPGCTSAIYCTLVTVGDYKIYYSTSMADKDYCLIEDANGSQVSCTCA